MFQKLEISVPPLSDRGTRKTVDGRRCVHALSGPIPCYTASDVFLCIYIFCCFAFDRKDIAMSGSGGTSKSRKRRQSFLGAAVGAVMGLAGLGGGQQQQSEDEELGPPAKETASSPSHKPAHKPRAARSSNRDREASGGGSAAAAAPPPSSSSSRSPLAGKSLSRSSRQTLQEAAGSALRALGGSPPGVSEGTPPVVAVAVAAEANAGSKGKGKGKVKSEDNDGEDQNEEDQGVSRNIKGKGKGKGKGKVGRGDGAVVKTEVGGSAGMSAKADLEPWTEREALERLRYEGQPLMSMRVAELKDALSKAGLSCAGNQPELRIRLGQRLCSDLAAGTPGLASMVGFEVVGVGSTVSRGRVSARDARRQKRRTSTMLKKGPDTKGEPIVISGSDEESESESESENDASTDAAQAPAPAAAAAAAAPTVSQTAAAVDYDASVTAASAEKVSESTTGRRGKRTRAARDAADTTGAAAETETKTAATAVHESNAALAKELANGPTPGMAFGELQKRVKALGLKPKGRKRSDLEDCWREAAKRTRKGAVKKEEGGGKGGSAADEAENGDGDGGGGPSLGGVAVKDMKVRVFHQSAY